MSLIATKDLLGDSIKPRATDFNAAWYVVDPSDKLAVPKFDIDSFLTSSTSRSRNPDANKPASNNEIESDSSWRGREVISSSAVWFENTLNCE